MKNRLLYIPLTFILVTLLVTACSKQSPAPGITAPNVYIAGYIAGGGSPLAVLWNNASTNFLSDTTTGSSIAYSIFGSGNDIYVGGWETVGGYNRATVWKNGVATNLSSPTLNAFIASIFISGSDVYAVGEGWDNYGDSTHMILWQNGIASILDSQLALVSSIFVSSKDVYIAGTNSSGAARYLRNGAPYDLAAQGSSSIFVDGSNVYVTANQVINTREVATYWINGTPVNLTAPQSSGTAAESLFVIGSDIYVSGYQTLNGINIATYWKNGNSNLLSNLSFNSFASSIFVLGTDVYAAGASNQLATYWKNGLEIQLSPKRLSYAEGIYAK